MQQPSRTCKTLAWSGMIPYVLILAAVSMNKIFSLIGYTPSPKHFSAVFLKLSDFIWPIAVVIISTYTALIVTFIAGSQWGAASQLAKKSSTKVMVCSNLAMVFAWLGMLVPNWIISFVMLLTCLWLVLLVDIRLTKHGIWSPAYLRLRIYITASVSICLAIFLLYLGRPFYH